MKASGSGTAGAAARRLAAATLRLLVAAVAMSALAAAAHAQDAGAGGSGGGGNGTGGGSGSGTGSGNGGGAGNGTGNGGAAVSPSFGQGFGQSLIPGQGGSLLQSGPPQPGGIGGGSGNTLPDLAGSTMRDRIAAALGLTPVSEATQPAFQFTPALTVQQGWTNNLYDEPGLASPSAFFTNISPSLSLGVDTGRVQASASYAPGLYLYEPSYGQDQVAQNFSAQAHVTLVPETLFVDFSAFGGQQTISGGLGPSNTTVPNNTDTEQDYGFTVSPYLQHRFGTFGTGEIGGSFTTTAQILPGTIVAAPLPGLPPVNLSDQVMTATEEHAVFTSGEDFGRWVSNAYVSTTQYGGTGVFVGGYDNTGEYEGGYAITRNITALATIGWDDLYFSGIPPVRVDEPLWNVGFQFTPNPDSSITVRYGRKDGITAAYVNGTYVPSPRLRFNANYSVTLSTDNQQLGNDLVNATSDPLGNPVNVQTGTPLLQNNNFLGMIMGVYKIEQALLSGTLLYDRDTFQLAFNQQSETPLNTIPGEPLFGTISGTYGTLTWTHNLSDALSTSLSAEYGVESGAFESVSYNGTTLVGTATVTYAISTTLSANLQYSHTISVFAGTPAFAVDLVMAGLTKTF